MARRRERTPEWLADIARRQRQRDEDDRRHTEALEAEHAAAESTTSPAAVELLRKAGLTNQGSR